MTNLDIRLSVLVRSVPERLEDLARLTADLAAQAEGRPVEILVLLDNRQRTRGAKMNALMDLAQGDYVTVVDDDDRVAPTYVEQLLDAIERHPEADCIVFDVALYLNGQFAKIFHYGLEYGWEETAERICREPGPLMCWRRQIAVRYRFPDQMVGSDSAWIQAGPWKSEPIRQERIEAVLYEYRAVPGHP